MSVVYIPCPGNNQVSTASATILIERVDSPIIPVNFISQSTTLCDSVFAVSEVMELEVFVDEATAKRESGADSITYDTVWASTPSINLDCKPGQPGCVVQNGGNGESTITLLANSLEPGISYVFNVTVIPRNESAKIFVESFSPLCGIKAVGNPDSGICNWVAVEAYTTEGCDSEVLQQGRFQCKDWTDPSDTKLLYAPEYLMDSGEWVGFGTPYFEPDSPYILDTPNINPLIVRTKVSNLLGGFSVSESQSFNPCFPSAEVLEARSIRALDTLNGCISDLDTVCQTRQLQSVSGVEMSMSSSLRSLSNLSLARQDDGDCLSEQVQLWSLTMSLSISTLVNICTF